MPIGGTLRFCVLSPVKWRHHLDGAQVIHRKLDRAERKAAIERHLDEAHTLDERGRRALLVLSDLPNREWRELRLGKLGVQLLINVDAPTTGDRFLLRLGASPHFTASHCTHGAGWASGPETDRATP
eukprot:SAG11_NODE_588_length_8329_cov_18.642857_3_plen_127_part_00